ncbi:uncharacterized protein LOC106668665 isoform X2 [Cimex lectularius]|uniref:Uncharacterized protein n=1 Tax=Cimex lectularius TaxID=79782 RepID=A0A8I6SHF0_CIMLE|nr:uncharacterized protein LOC106668665 isoform X2 [Cimex lectularius]
MKNELEKFIQRVHNKVIIATAITIIKIKPIGTTIEDHFKNIKTQCVLAWEKEEINSPFQSKIIKYLQKYIINEISDLIPTQPNKCIEEINQLSSQFSELCLDMEDKTSSDESSSYESNSEFIKAIIKLKSIVNTKRTLTFQSSTPFHHWNVSMRHITHSSGTDIVLTKCLETIFTFLGKAILINGTESFNNWKGSVLEHVCYNIKKSAFDPDCTFFIVKFLRKALEFIWSSKSDGKITSCECQMLMLNELCCTFEICKHAMEMLIGKIELISEAANIASYDCSIDLLEKTPHFLHLTLRLLKKLLQLRRKSAKTKAVQIDWKIDVDARKLDDETSPIVVDIEEKLLNSWKEKCEKLVITSGKIYPLIGTSAWRIVKNLDKLGKNGNENLLWLT